MAIKANHPFKAMYAPVSGVDTPDPYTAVIRLSKPHPAILLCMSPVLCPIMPKHVYGTDPNIRQNPANKAPIGSGPVQVRGMEARRLHHAREEQGLFH